MKRIHDFRSAFCSAAGLALALASPARAETIPCPGGVSIRLSATAGAPAFTFDVNAVGIPAKSAPPQTFAVATNPSNPNVTVKISARSDAATRRLFCDVARVANPIFFVEMPFPAGATACRIRLNRSNRNFFCDINGNLDQPVPCPILAASTQPSGQFTSTTSTGSVITTVGLADRNPNRLRCNLEPIPASGLHVSRGWPNDGLTYVAEGGTRFVGQGSGGGTGGSAGGGAIVVEAESMSKSTGGATSGGWNIWSNGNISKSVSLTAGRQYQVVVSAKATRAQNQGAAMSVRFGGQLIGSTTVSAASYANHSFSFRPSQGTADLRIEFTNDLNANGEDRNLIVDKITFTPM